MIIKNRQEAGILLADLLIKNKVKFDIILGIPRGGVVVAFEIKRITCAPLFIPLAHKIRSLYNPEFAIGGCFFKNGKLLYKLADYAKDEDEEYLRKELSYWEENFKKRYELYYPSSDIKDLKGKKILIVDDGVATGETIKTLINFLEEAGKIMVAVPVLSTQFAQFLKESSIIYYTLIEDPYLEAVGAYYDDFSQVEDKDIVMLLKNI